MNKRTTLSILLLFLLLTLQSCSHYEVPRDGMLATISQLSIRNEDDSAMALLEKVDTAALKEGDRAFYDLLTVKTRYRLNRKALPDAVIDHAIAIFGKTARNDSLLADAWFYKGAVACDTGRVTQYNPAINSLHQAQVIAERHHYIFLLDKVYEKLSNINLFSNQFRAALTYAQKLKTIADDSGNQYL